jgi:trans-2,3-dihydro-3-hydroxyanthranilate isomerase
VFGLVIDDRKRIADILSIDVSDLVDALPIQLVSTGLPSVIVPLKTRAAVARCAIRADRYQQFLDDTVKAALLVFAPEPEDPANDLRVRVFVDDPGFFEDPATGSANGNLAGYLVQHRYFGKDAVQYRVEQGYEMGRPSLLHVAAEKNGDDISIRVGGRVFRVAGGDWE